MSVLFDTRNFTNTYQPNIQQLNCFKETQFLPVKSSKEGFATLTTYSSIVITIFLFSFGRPATYLTHFCGIHFKYHNKNWPLNKVRIVLIASRSGVEVLYRTPCLTPVPNSKTCLSQCYVCTSQPLKKGQQGSSSVRIWARINEINFRFYGCIAKISIELEYNFLKGMCKIIVARYWVMILFSKNTPLLRFVLYSRTYCARQ